MAVLCLLCVLLLVALRKESVDRNLIGGVNRVIDIVSLSARRAWIEIEITLQTVLLVSVALRKESVDRNARLKLLAIPLLVALRKESVDRNRVSTTIITICIAVALRKESVDRNIFMLPLALISPVALRKESVDRNRVSTTIITICIASLSARRAWIEIIDYVIDYVNDASRSPQGERG